MFKWTPIVAIVTIAALECFALWRGIDGVTLAAGIAVIAGLAGYTAPHKKPPS